jgi:hypothetical protein
MRLRESHPDVIGAKTLPIMAYLRTLRRVT